MMGTNYIYHGRECVHKCLFSNSHEVRVGLVPRASHESFASGYIAQEYAYSMKASEKSDVYNLGIVLMELVSGLMPTNKKFGVEMDMVRWVQSKIRSDSREELLGPELKLLELHEESSMLEVLDVDVDLQCTRTAPAERPTSRQVSDLLCHISMRSNNVGSGKKLGYH